MFIENGVVELLLSALAVIIAIGIYNIKKYSEKITYVFTVYFISISLMMIISVLYTSKLSDYVYTIQLDYKLYLFLSKIRIHIDNLARLHNFSVIIFMFASLMLLKVLSTNKFTIRYIFYILPIVFFYVINDPTIKEYLYIRMNDINENVVFWNSVNYIIKGLNEIIVLFYVFIPIIKMIRILNFTALRMRRKHTSLLLFCTSLIHFFVYAVMLNGFWQNINYNNREILGFPDGYGAQKGYIIIPLAVVTMVGVILFVFLKFKPYQFQTNSSVWYHKNLARNMLNDLGVFMHNYKNAFINAKRLTVIALEDIDTNVEECKNHLKLLEQMLSQRIYTINEEILLTKALKLKNDSVDINECVKYAIKNNVLPSNIKISSTNSVYGDVVIKGDFKHISEVINNILHNAVQAINKKSNNENGHISISVWNEDEYYVVDITDNGIGMSEEDSKKVFRAFWSGDMSLHNSGIGLTYAKSIISKHGGDLEVISKLNVGTTMRIVLPSEKAKKFYGNFK